MAALPPSPPWTELPDDLMENILQRLDTEDIVMGAQLVCSTWWRLCKNPALWRVNDLIQRSYTARNICRCGPHKLGSFCDCTADRFWSICRFAVDHSEGQLVELKLACFEMGGFLNYLAQRLVNYDSRIIINLPWKRLSMTAHTSESLDLQGF
ncbi:F-box protein SKIP19-like [Salvia hispanica]|uniref:F-box protein SKIP19-like n=1 Tax=Salvia hispanica TaxID=49212 RepID=UPI00200980B3|nr:F-box protein SKIP19-like [Salvia hispanica]